ncbi:unnamed protein product [Linum trigynum]|uniref:Uncharacterized protein n=1 Tax=Linum trigynum TaxID=586398 RepID=A0AAV2E236_9ROSI
MAKKSSKIAPRMFPSRSLSRVRPLGVWDPKTQLSRFFGSEFGLKPGNPDSHGQGARPCISPFWPCNSKRRVSFSRTSALSHGQGARPCELQGFPVRVLGIRRTAILLTCTAVQPPWSARAAPQKPRHSSVLRPIDPRLAPKPSFT